MKIGIFGGTFSPPHLGHVACVDTVLKKAGLDKVLVIPASRNPLKHPVEGPSAEDRFAMTKLAFSDFGANVTVDSRELDRGGASYTIETVRSLQKENPADEFYLIIGMDKMEELADWKEAESLLKEVHFIFVSRPGFDFPKDKSDLPEFLQNATGDFDFNFVELKTGKTLQFLRLKDVEISGTEIRKWLRIGKSVQKYLPLAVENYIREHKLYAPLKDRIGDFEAFTHFCAQVIFDKKGIQPRAFDLTALSAPTEYTLVASGTSTRHAAALAENIMQAVKAEYNVHALSLEGIEEGRWVLIDYGALIVHIFYDYVRQEYALENLWKNGKELTLSDKKL